MISSLSAQEQQVQAKFDIAFYGDVREGFDEHHAKRSLKALFNLPDYTIDAMFMACRTVIKGNIDIITAKKYRQKLYTYGIDAAIELTAPSKVAAAETLSNKAERLAFPFNETSPSDFPVDPLDDELAISHFKEAVYLNADPASEATLDPLFESTSESLIPGEDSAPTPALDVSDIEAINDTINTAASKILPLESQLLLEAESDVSSTDFENNSETLAHNEASESSLEMPAEYRFASHQTTDLLEGFDEFEELSRENEGEARDYVVPTKAVGAPQYVLFALAGETVEYSKIWWLNTLMTLFSCGLHRPYVDANRKRYFYKHLTTPKGEQFDYDGPSSKLINGYWPLTAWALGFLCLAVISLKGALVLAAVSMVFIAPYCFITIRHHHLAATRFRGAPFRFTTDYISALQYLVGWPLLAAISLGWLLPRALMSIHRYIIENTDYAGIPFKYRATYKDYISAAVGIAVIGLCGVAAIRLDTWYFILPAIAGCLFALWVWSMVKLINVYYNHAEWQGFKFYANYQLASYGWLVMVNIVGVVLSAGLLIPWALIRLAKYKALHISLVE